MRYSLRMDTGSSRVPPDRDSIAATLRAERARARLTMDELAERSGLSKSTIVRLEAGRRAPDTDQLAQLAAVFGLKVSEILRAAEASAHRVTR